MQANQPSNRPSGVAILFEEDIISALFAELVQSQGVPTRIIRSTKELGSAERLITEIRYYREIPERLISNTLVVGNKDSLQGIPSLCLTRPLTESKVESALSQFLSNR